jgi:hypothetical protein
MISPRTPLGKLGGRKGGLGSTGGGWQEGRPWVDGRRQEERAQVGKER